MDMANLNRVAVQYIPPVMVVVGFCSMNEKIVPFTLSKIGLLVVIAAVILAYTLLHYVVSKCHDDPDWWKEDPGWMGDWFHATVNVVGRALGGLFHGLQARRARSPIHGSALV
jgi:hypothetical protein